MALLAAIDLGKSFRHQWTMRPIPVLEHVAFEVDPGEILGLIGPNGAGKTTTIKLLLALLRPTRGRVEFEGQSVTRPRARRGIGFLPEQPYFYDYLTLTETLEFYGQLYGMTRADRRHRIRQLIDQLDLGSLGAKTMRQLSKGNLQRVGIAQAIMHHPRLAILDEPMSGLDPAGRKEMRDLIAGLRANGTSVIISSHILPDAEALCDRVAVIARGRLREIIQMTSNDGSDSPFIVTASGLPAAALAALRQLARERVTGGPAQWSFRLDSRATAQRAITEILAANAFVEAVMPDRPSLEERFLAYVGDQRGNGHAGS